MSANPTRLDCEVPGPPQEGNRVLESIARQEALRALLAFSGLHDQIRTRRAASGHASDRDLFETERFILDEVLQLICGRARAITQADGVMVALMEGPHVVSRAAAGPLSVERGVRLIESDFLQDCLETGRILRCDDCEIDTRVELDMSCQMGARSTVIVPLRGRREQLGVLQAFSRTPWAFTDQDIRCFDLFAELVLSGLRPEDQDRRLYWLSDLAGDVLRAKPPVFAPVTKVTAEVKSTESAANQFVSVESDSVDTVALDTDTDGTDGETLPSHSLPFLQGLSRAGNSHPGLSVVMGLVAVAALFSAGTWWGMQEHGKSSVTKVRGSGTRITVAPQAETKRPTAPAEVLSLAISDNLADPEKDGTDSAPLTEAKLAALPKITGVRHWSSSTGSTVVIDMEDQAPYEVHRLMSPERIYFDLHNTVLLRELNGRTMDVGDELLSRVRIAQPVAGVSRVVLDTKDGSNFSVSMESSPYRLVVELRGGGEKTLAKEGTAPRQNAPKRIVPQQNASKQFASSETRPPDAAAIAMKAAPVATLTAKVSDSALPARSGKFRVVLDAGHGGWDLGTVGRQGLLEKDLVLDVAQRLAKLLQTRLGSEVMFTRSDDTYLPLEQRADFANSTQADVFVSVHANYSSSAAARGVETYYTNLFSAPGSREVEKHDDGTFTKPTLVSLSADGLHEKIEESRRLAASVQRSLYSTLAAKNPDIRDRGIKDSAFAVLTGTTMPAILTEISFVSSPVDEHNLQTAAYRQQIAEALYQGIARYQQSSPRAKVAQLQTTAAQR